MNARRAIFEIYLDYVQYYGGSIRLRSLLALGEELGLTTTAMRAALCRLCSQGWLQVTPWEKQSFYALTEMGRPMDDADLLSAGEAAPPSRPAAAGVDLVGLRSASAFGLD